MEREPVQIDEMLADQSNSSSEDYSEGQLKSELSAIIQLMRKESKAQRRQGRHPEDLFSAFTRFESFMCVHEIDRFKWDIALEFLLSGRAFRHLLC